MAHPWQGWITVGMSGLLALGSWGAGGAIAQQTEPVPTEPETTDPAGTEIPAPTGETTPDPAVDGARFTCEVRNGQYTVMYAPKSQPDQLYPWAVPGNMGSEWPAERRCYEISRRLEEYRPDGLLELRTGIENGYDTVCATTEAVSSCRIVFTVPPGQDAIATRDSVFDNLVLADQGQSTQGVNTFAEGDSILDEIGDVLGLPSENIRPARSGIDLQPFLDPTDGGTGTQLIPAAGRQLNPDNF